MIANYGNAVAPIARTFLAKHSLLETRMAPFALYDSRRCVTPRVDFFLPAFFSSVCQVSKLLPRINYDCIHADSRLCRDAQYDSDDCFIM